VFLLLLHLLQEKFHIKVPAVFEYSSTRMALAAITSLLVTLIFGQFFIKKLYEWKIGDRVRTEDCPLLGELHRNKNDTPTMGGILIIFALLVSLFLWMQLNHMFTIILLITTCVMGFLGGYDDYLKLRFKNKKGLSGKGKLCVQVLFALVLAAYLLIPSFTKSLEKVTHLLAPTAKEMVVKDKVTSTAILTTKTLAARIYLPFYKKHVIEVEGRWLVLMALFFVIVIVGSSNAVNLTDGLDGLATGTVMLAAGAFALIAFLSNHIQLSNYLHILYIEGSGEIAIFMSAVVGACLGFLWYNSHPAQVFMGDTGSLPLGAILGVSAVLLKRELLLAIIGGVFVLEALSVLLQVGSYRMRNKKRLFLCAPIHHHFEYKGWPETKVVVRFWIVGLLCALIGIASIKFQ
jgi:phospho-N-acetylmuramoyl-pentapeptide-transferase